MAPQTLTAIPNDTASRVKRVVWHTLEVAFIAGIVSALGTASTHDWGQLTPLLVPVFTAALQALKLWAPDTTAAVPPPKSS